MAISFGSDGKATEIQDPALLRQLEESGEKMAEAEEKALTQKERIAALLRPSSRIIVKTETIEFDGITEEIAIRQLAYREASRIDGKKYRKKAGGQVSYETEYAETVGTAWALHETVMRDANEGKTDKDGKALEPDWVRMFTLEEVLGDGKEGEVDANSLMGNPESKASEFVFALTSAVWRVNPTLSPLSQGAAMDALGMT